MIPSYYTVGSSLTKYSYPANTREGDSDHYAEAAAEDYYWRNVDTDLDFPILIYMYHEDGSIVDCLYVEAAFSPTFHSYK